METDLVALMDKNAVLILWSAIIGVAGLVLTIIFFAVQLWRFGPDIRKLNKFETIAQLSYFAERQKEMTHAFGAATAASREMIEVAGNVRADLDSLRDFVTDIQEKMSEYNADSIMKARLEEEEEAQPGTLFRKSATPAAVQTPASSQQFESMKLEWNKFLDAFKKRLTEAGILPQLNRMGKMTYMLTDRRRKQPLPVETADLITALHSQYRRHVALQRVSPEEHDNFVRLVKTAIDELRRTLPPEKPLNMGLPLGNGASDHDRSPTGRLM